MSMPWEKPVRPELQQDPVTGMYPGEAETGLPDFLRAVPRTLLCDDEGCPQHGTPHVCVTPAANPQETAHSWAPPWEASS